MKKIIPILALFLFSSLLLPPPPPPDAMAPYLNGVFPDISPNTNWKLEDPLPGITFKSPLRIEPLPQTDDYLILCKSGELWQVSFENQSRKLILDIQDRTIDVSEAGLIGMALHPKFGDVAFPDKQNIYVFYRYYPSANHSNHLGFNRLSKIPWNENEQKFDENQEEILIQQYDRNLWHNGGGMFFGNDGFLYLSVGDEGILNGHPAELHLSTQRLDLGFFNGILRIDVDNDPSKSHPIRRQPLSLGEPPAGWGETYSQGYSIPNDNPWLSEEGEYLEEFFALGVRSPYSMFYDPLLDKIWLSDVGSDKMEEISIVEKGDNLQWPYLEGVVEYRPKPENLIGKDKPPHLTYPRSEGMCIIGGCIYRGQKYPQLDGKFLYSDYMTNKIWAIPSNSDIEEPTPEVLVDNISSNNNDLELPEKPGITGIFQSRDEEIMVAVMHHHLHNTGKIYRMVRKVDIPNVPQKLSEIKAFADLATLEPRAGLIPYQINSPLWSDRATKKRWMALPNDGQFDSSAEQITFSKNGDWGFPSGTVFVKHFDLPLTTDPSGPSKRLETRFFIIDKNKQGYGLTYKWNEEDTEAFLLSDGLSEEFTIEENGSTAFTQKWDYPSSDQCLSCHNHNANYVLGLKTHQLNSTIEYPKSGTMNQLDYLNLYNIFDQPILKALNYQHAVPIEDESASLELRILSYLDSNCASCHRPGGVNQVNLDLRFSTSFELRKIIGEPALSHASPFGSIIVQPGSHETSELWVRDASLEENRMPPLASNLVDEVYIDVLAEWIDGLSADADRIQELTVYPNPTSGIFQIQFSDDWEGEFAATVYSISGQVITKEKGQTPLWEFDLRTIPNGQYLIEIKGGDKKELKRIVKW